MYPKYLHHIEKSGVVNKGLYKEKEEEIGLIKIWINIFSYFDLQNESIEKYIDILALFWHNLNLETMSMRVDTCFLKNDNYKFKMKIIIYNDRNQSIRLENALTL